MNSSSLFQRVQGESLLHLVCETLSIAPLYPLFPASPFPFRKPGGKAKPPVNLNRYNSCRPKQYTEENKKSSVSRQRLGQCAREAAVNCKCILEADSHVRPTNPQTHTIRATHEASKCRYILCFFF